MMNQTHFIRIVIGLMPALLASTIVGNPPLLALPNASSQLAKQNPTTAEDPPLETLLANLPITGVEPVAKLQEQLRALSDESYLELCRRCRGSDATAQRAQWLLSAAAVLAIPNDNTASPERALRQRILAGIVASLPDATATGKRAFLDILLSLGWDTDDDGRVAIHAAVTEFLTDPEFVSRACHVLETHPIATTPAALLAAYPQLSPKGKACIARSLAKVATRATLNSEQQQQACALLTPDLRTPPDTATTLLWHAVVDALIDLGAPRETLLATLTKPARTPLESGLRSERLLRYARVLYQGQDQAAARQIIDSLRDSGHAASRSAALYTWADLAGAAAVPAVVTALGDANAELRAAAVNLATTLRGAGVNAAFIKLLDSAPLATQLSVLEVLGRRNEAEALPQLLALLERCAPLADRSTDSGDKDERRSLQNAAVTAVAQVGGERAFAPLLALLERESLADAKHLTIALTHLDGTITPLLAPALTQAHAEEKVSTCRALLEIIRQRRAKECRPVVWGVVTGTENPKLLRTGVATLGSIAPLSDVPRFLTLHESKPQPPRSLLAKALSRVCLSAAATEVESTLLNELATVRATPQREKSEALLLTLIARVGRGTALFQQLLPALSDRRNSIKNVATEGLGQWQDPSVVPLLNKALSESDEFRVQVYGTRALVRLTLASDQAGVDKCNLIFAALNKAGRLDQKIWMISRLGTLHDVNALKGLRPFLQEKSLAVESAWAILAICEGLFPAARHPIAEALADVVATTTEVAVRQRAQQLSARVADLDAVLDWVAAGPFTKDNLNGNQLLAVKFPVEDDFKNATWRPQPINPGDTYWFIDLLRSIGNHNAVAYLRTELYSPREQQLRFHLGSDDGIKVWVNAEIVHENVIPRGCQIDQDQVDVTLNKGWNSVLLKVGNLGGGWAATLRLRHLDGSRAPEIRARSPLK